MPEYVWITKYALTDGIWKCRVDPGHSSSLSDHGYMWVVLETAPNGYAMFTRKEWHATESRALARAEEMRLARIASLRKNIKHLETIQIKVTDRA